MGQPISVVRTTVDGDVAAFHTDRGITGQDGAAFVSGDEATGTGSLPGNLAARLFAADDAVSNVFIVSNQVVGSRAGGWDDPSLAAISETITTFFVFYAEA